MRFILLIFLFLSVHLSIAQKDILKDPVASKVAEKAVNYLNNFQFDAFDKEVEKLRPNYELHPAYPLLKSMSLYYQSLVDMNHKAEDLEYIKLLDQVVGYSEKILLSDPNSPEGVFFALTGYGYRAQYFSDNGSFFKAVGEGKKAYKYYKQGRQYKDELNELYFMTGLFNYLLVQYPENHPIVKPLMGFFQKGDKQLGLEQLHYGSVHAIFTKASCFSYSAYLYTKFEENYKKGKQYTSDFYAMNPNNNLNKVNYIIALLFNKDYEKALPLINSLKKEKNEFYTTAWQLFTGWYTSEQAKDYEAALGHFEVFELLSKKNTSITNDLQALACYKKAQIYELQNNNEEAKAYYKKALNSSSYEEIKNAYKNLQQKKKI
jgi:tetratricopeptide (TPR) repeat protein